LVTRERPGKCQVKKNKKKKKKKKKRQAFGRGKAEKKFSGVHAKKNHQKSRVEKKCKDKRVDGKAGGSDRKWYSIENGM